MSRGDRLDYMRSWTIGDTLTLYDTKQKSRPTSRRTAHFSKNVFVVYLDG